KLNPSHRKPTLWQFQSQVPPSKASQHCHQRLLVSGTPLTMRLSHYIILEVCNPFLRQIHKRIVYGGSEHCGAVLGTLRRNPPFHQSKWRSESCLVSVFIA